MMRPMSIYITTGEKVRGKAWAIRYPARAADLYVVGQVGDKKTRILIGPPTPKNKLAAEQKVVELEAMNERQRLRSAGAVTLRFSETSADWIKHGLRSRAPKTVTGREYQVGVLKVYFGTDRMDMIDAQGIAEWWHAEIDGKKRDIRTGKAYLNVLSMIFKHAAKTEPNIVNPVPQARQLIFGDIAHTAEFRARDEEHCNPLTSEEMAKLLPALERHGNRDLLLTVLLGYECGLRLGEATGLQWGDVWFGRDESDVSRHVHVQRSRTNGTQGYTKSGRSRKVFISRRLRSLLLERQMAAGRPGPKVWVIEQNWGSNIRERLERVCTKAKIQRHTPKDFRDTYASTLITHGIVLKWISLQLGHASLTVTERHYASYMATESYQNPWVVPPGCLPTDLFVTLDSWAGTTRAHAGTKERKA